MPQFGSLPQGDDLADRREEIAGAHSLVDEAVRAADEGQAPVGIQASGAFACCVPPDPTRLRVRLQPRLV